MTDWKENTATDPFWQSKAAVEVELDGGKTKSLQCPKCARSMMPFVKRWRPVGTSIPEPMLAAMRKIVSNQ